VSAHETGGIAMPTRPPSTDWVAYPYAEFLVDGLKGVDISATQPERSCGCHFNVPQTQGRTRFLESFRTHMPCLPTLLRPRISSGPWVP